MFISQALASTEAVTEHAVPFYEHPTFWVAWAFVLFFVFFGKKMWVTISGMLDERSAAISNQIEEATCLREEAQELLASYEKKQHDALKEAQNIVEAAKDEAQRLAAEAASQLDRNLKRSEQLATDRIAQAQAQAIAEVKSMAVDIAMNASQRILENDLSASKANELVDDAVKNLGNKLS